MQSAWFILFFLEEAKKLLQKHMILVNESENTQQEKSKKADSDSECDFDLAPPSEATNIPRCTVKIEEGFKIEVKSFQNNFYIGFVKKNSSRVNRFNFSIKSLGTVIDGLTILQKHINQNSK